MIHCLDLHFLGHSDAIGSYLIETTDGPVLIESGPHSTIDHLSRALSIHGYQLEDIKHVFLTHIHLDHAGAAWLFAEKGATIHLHPFGADHMAEPARLMDSARRIYKDKMDMLWGQMNPIERNQLHVCDHLETVKVGDFTFTALHTPGHAKHHIAWQLGDAVFTGDVAGVKIKNGPVVPPCPPPDINLEDWKASIEIIKERKSKKLYLTHFGAIESIEEHFSGLTNMLDDWAHWIKKEWESGKSAEELTPEFSAYTKQQLLSLGVSEPDTEKYEAANPSWMSVAGLIRYWTKKSQRS